MFTDYLCSCFLLLQWRLLLLNKESNTSKTLATSISHNIAEIWSHITLSQLHRGSRHPNLPRYLRWPAGARSHCISELAVIWILKCRRSFNTQTFGKRNEVYRALVICNPLDGSEHKEPGCLCLRGGTNQPSSSGHWRPLTLRPRSGGYFFTSAG